jgi:hypothetical protein
MVIHSKHNSVFFLFFSAATLRYRGISIAFFFTFLFFLSIYLFFDNDANTNVRWSTLLFLFRTQQHENRKLIYIEHCLSFLLFLIYVVVFKTVTCSTSRSRFFFFLFFMKMYHIHIRAHLR